jgi:hypothetical protein
MRLATCRTESCGVGRTSENAVNAKFGCAPVRWPCTGPIRARGGRYYLCLDAYAPLWILSTEKPPDEQA